MLSGASGEALTACGAVVRVRAGVLGTCYPPVPWDRRRLRWLCPTGCREMLVRFLYDDVTST